MPKDEFQMSPKRQAQIDEAKELIAGKEDINNFKMMRQDMTHTYNRAGQIEAGAAALAVAVKRPVTVIATLKPSDELTKQFDRPINIKATLNHPEPKSGGQKFITRRKKFSATVAALFQHHVKKTPLADTILETMPGDEYRKAREAPLNALVNKSPTDTATTTGVGYAAELVESDNLGWYKAVEAPSAMVDMVRAKILNPLPFGRNNTVTIPRRPDASKGSMAMSFVGENATIPTKQDSYAGQSFRRYKAAVISTFSNELADQSTPTIESLIQQSIEDDTTVMLDTHFLSENAAVPEISPAGILVGANTTATTDIDTDLGWMINALRSNRSRKPVMIMDDMMYTKALMHRDSGLYIYRDELQTKGTIFGIPVLHSPNSPANMLIGLDGDKIGMGLETPEVDMSSAATIVLVSDDGVDPTMANTNAVSVAGSVKVSDAATVTGGPAEVISTFQMNATAIRSVVSVTWGPIAENHAHTIPSTAW
jgi:hypothetical protein